MTGTQIMKKAALTLLAAINVLLSCQSTSLKSQKADDSRLIDFHTDESIKRLSESSAKVDFFALANHFEAQSNAIFCGPTSATIVLNTIHATKPQLLPKDTSRLNRINPIKLPRSVDISLSRHTQETIVSKSPKDLKRVFGAPRSIKGKTQIDPGYQLREFDGLLRAHGLKTKLRVLDANISDKTALNEIITNLKQRNNYVIINYKRSGIGQKGGGHISPIGAYDEHSHSFLILDVNPAKALWIWVPAKNLLKGMRSFDKRENRGYVLVEG